MDDASTKASLQKTAVRRSSAAENYGFWPENDKTALSIDPAFLEREQMAIKKQAGNSRPRRAQCN